MKISLALGHRGPISRQTAWGCLTTNVAMPGFGSLVAGRVSGYFQVVLGLAGLAITMLFGLRAIYWCVTHWAEMQSPDADPVRNLTELWLAIRWPLAGIGVFAAGWLWALGTSLDILRVARKEPHNIPPNLA